MRRKVHFLLTLIIVMTGRNIYIHIVALLIAVLLPREQASALPLDTYAAGSILAEGSFVKIAVEEDGLYCIPATTLRSWGFSDPSRVRIYGYPSRRIPDALTQANFVDDLPQVQSMVTDQGVVFYGAAAGQWIYTSTKGLESYYVPNDFSVCSYYYVTESDATEARPLPSSGTAGASAAATTEFTDRIHHERELVSPGEAGPMLVGEDFRYTPSRIFDFTLTDPLAQGWLRTSFVTHLFGTSSKLSFTINSTPLAEVGSDYISASSRSEYVHGTETVTTHSFNLPESTALRVGVSFSGDPTCDGAWLNSLTINYSRRLRLGTSGVLMFRGNAGEYALQGASAATKIWDVTDPTDICEVAYSLDGSEARWTLPGRREYVAWNASASLPAPAVLGFVANQNLHAHQGVDMIIVAPAAFTAQAERLAEYHRNSADSLTVHVVDPEHIYNEFGSGSPDVGAIRRYFKMIYDRGLAGRGHPLRYAILMARTSFDTRRLTAAAPDYPIVPAWMPAANSASLSDNEGYSTDDVCAMLADGSGASLGYDKLNIAIGRIPATDVAEARQIVDKTLQYALAARKTAWKHRFLFLADDEDAGRHIKQTETLINSFADDPANRNLVRKIYTDAFERVGKTYPVARQLMYRSLDEGVVWWNFIGHANTTSWTGEGMLTYTDLNQMYLRYWPFIYAATCNFLRLDGTEVSGAEVMYKERYGGAIGIISAVRPVYISDNGLLSAAIGRALARRDERGRLLTPGEIYRTAKNDVQKNLGDMNRLRYIFLGDPALHLAMPANLVVLDSIAGRPADAEEQPTLAALARVPMSGHIADPDGNLLAGFNGTVMIEIFDAERSVTTNGYGEGEPVTFEEYGDRIFTGAAQVRDGRFETEIAMPSEIAQNFRPATMSLYAFDVNDDTEAIGLDRSFYVYGFDDAAPADADAPVIESLVLNHSSFRSGDTVNDSPMLIATVRDDIGINVSTAGIGHQMTAILDGDTTFPDLSDYYTPSSDGTASGVINYPFSGLTPGDHSLTLRVWDTSGNPATADIRFNVAANIAPKIYDVYTDANPASTQANFYLTHDQPDAMATVTITVYNLIGRPVWSSSVTGRSDMFTTVPVTWDLSDAAGRRVGRGIYLYRATITTDGTTYETASKRIAVTAQ